MYKVLLLNGPNLNLLGWRKHEVYGNVNLPEILRRVHMEAVKLGCELEAKQSNHEGDLIDWVQRAAIPEKTFNGIILNADGLTHTSISLRDAVETAEECGVPTIEVHLSDIHARDEFRHVSFLTKVCITQISGLGPDGYLIALQQLIDHLQKQK
jgi:3-dehydroquinate dehydratase II